MIGNELWDRSLFGIVMVAIGVLFIWGVWGRSWLLVCVGIANILFGIYIIWGAFAWRGYKEKVWERYGRKSRERKTSGKNRKPS